jgi:hypothetical protein
MLRQWVEQVLARSDLLLSSTDAWLGLASWMTR